MWRNRIATMLVAASIPMLAITTDAQAVTRVTTVSLACNSVANTYDYFFHGSGYPTNQTYYYEYDIASSSPGGNSHGGNFAPYPGFPTDSRGNWETPVHASSVSSTPDNITVAVTVYAHSNGTGILGQNSAHCTVN